MKKKLVIFLLSAILLLQLFQPQQNDGEIYTNSHISHVVHTPSEVNTLLENACYDCHSNQTIYPWYSHIQPLAWWLNHHIEEGKSELNFSAFKDYSLKRQKHKLDEIAEMVREKEMPLYSYTLVHSQARLSNDEMELLAVWALHSKAKLEAPKDSIQH
jgi:hypothetical protein